MRVHVDLSLFQCYAERAGDGVDVFVAAPGEVDDDELLA
jgi:hypothetical protein